MGRPQRSSTVPITFDKGLVNSRDASTLAPGELSQAVAVEYRPGIPYPQKLNGRLDLSAVFTGGVSSAPVRSIQLCQYDSASATDKLVAIANTGIYEFPVKTSNFTTPTDDAAPVSGITLTATTKPTWANLKDRWIMCSGTDKNYIREPGTVPGKSINWRPLGLNRAGIASATNLGSAGAIERVSGSSNGSPGYSFSNNTSVLTVVNDDDQNSYAYALVNETTPSRTCTWTFTALNLTNMTGTRYVKVQHSLNTSAGSSRSGIPQYKQDLIYGFDSDYAADDGVPVVVSHTITATYNFAGGNGTATLSTKKVGHNLEEASFVLPTGACTSLSVTATMTYTSGSPDASATGRVYEVYVTSGATVAASLEYPLYYTVTEVYTDSEGFEVESLSNDPAVIAAAATPTAPVTSYGVTVTLPAVVNTSGNGYGTIFRRIYRSVAAINEGYPNMWAVGVALSTDTTWFDSFAEAPGVTPVGRDLLKYITVNAVEGGQFPYEVSNPPPRAKQVVEFQNCLVYVPDAAQTPKLAKRVYYSMPASTNPAAMEQVPEVNALEFATPVNDQVQAVCTCNGGRSLMVYFQSYSLMVSRLPQWYDPGAFDTRITEYVSNVRGCLSTRACCEFSLPTGQTLAAAVDALGLWVTDGVSSVVDWSRDIDWDALIAVTTLSNAVLVDNSRMRRLELIYKQDLSDNAYKEYHFFYGRTKQDVDGNTVPLITGPHPMKTAYKHYAPLSGAIVGWSGSSADASGKLFLERGAVADGANAYDGSGTVPYQLAGPDLYTAGLGAAVLVRFGYPKFESGSKAVTVTGTFRRDGFSSAQTAAKTFTIGTDKKVYWQRYADRHKVAFSDLTATALPGLVGYELEIRPLGEGRET